MHVLRIASRGQMHTHALGAPDGDHRIGYFKHESGTVFNRSTVCVRTMIGSVLQELIDQVAIGSMNLHTVKASQLCVLCSLAEGLNDARDFGRLKCAWRHIIDSGTHQAHMASGSDRAGCNRQFSIKKAWVRDAPHMPELCKDATAGMVHRLGHQLPRLDLLRQPDPRHICVANALRYNWYAFGDD